MADWDDTVADDVRNQVPAGIAREVLKPKSVKVDFCEAIHVVTPDYPTWLQKTDPGRKTALKDSVIDFRRKRDTYINTVIDILDRMTDTDTGWALATEICATKRKLWIRPHTIYNTNPKEPIGAQAGAFGPTGAADPQAVEDGTSVGMPLYGSDGKLRSGSGTGKGADTIVNFSPGQWGPGAKYQGPGYQPDEVLIHEMIHAARIMRGVAYMMPVNQGYENEEEYLSVVISNIYISDKTKGTGALRADHEREAHVLLQPEKFLSNVQGVNLSPITLIERFRLRTERFYKDLAAVKTRFNPIRQFEQLRKAGKIRNRSGTMTFVK